MDISIEYEQKNKGLRSKYGHCDIYTLLAMVFMSRIYNFSSIETRYIYYLHRHTMPYCHCLIDRLYLEDITFVSMHSTSEPQYQVSDCQKKWGSRGHQFPKEI